ncbi:MAG: hypothetical protein ACKV2T_19790 [Kofleriaceae bacterium]
MRLDFINAAKTGRWKVAGASLTGECEGVAFTGERLWWGGSWTVVGEAEFRVPEKVLLFISEEGMEHGFWRDMSVGESAFDTDHFVFCDTPGLLRLIVGPTTRAAIARREKGQKPIKVYARNGRLQTKGKNSADDDGAIARHVAIHQAFATDHAALVDKWQSCLESASGRGGATWPLNGQINSRVGTLLVGLTWEMKPETRDGAEWDSGYRSLRTEVSAFGDRHKAQWVLVEVDAGTHATHVIGPRRYRLRGTPNLPFERIARLVEDSDLAALSFGAKLTVSLRDLANERRLQAAVALIEQLLSAEATSQSPYR